MGFYDDNKFGLSIDRRHEMVLKIMEDLDLDYKNCKVLDTGCGGGAGLKFAKEKLQIKEAYGLDISSSNIENLNKLGIKGYALNLDNENFPFEDNEFDVIISIEVIEHLYNPDLYLKEVYRTLKPGGLFLITTPNLSWWINILGLFRGYQPIYTDTSLNVSLGHLNPNNVPLGHLRSYTVRGLTKLLEYHNFTLISKKGLPFIWFKGVRHLIDKLIASLSVVYSCDLCLILEKTSKE